MNHIRARLFTLTSRAISSRASHSFPVARGKEELSKWEQTDGLKTQDLRPDALSTNVDAELIDSISPSIKKSFNLAAYVNLSETLQNLLKLNVNLSEIDQKVDLASYLVTCDYKSQIEPYIEFMVRKVKIPINNVGDVINRNPFLFKIPLDDLQVRCNYFAFRKFSKKDIATIFERSPSVFNLPTSIIDGRLGFLQKHYSLSPSELRSLIVSYPRLMNLRELQVKDTTFMFKDELGFTAAELKNILMTCAVLWRKYHNPSGHQNVVRIFDYVHNTMGFTHEVISKHAQILNQRMFLIKQRHEYLKSMKRDQYDPCKPLYVPLNAFYQLADADFCLKYCKTTVSDFNNFLKTL